jgi:antitoxin HicB
VAHYRGRQTTVPVHGDRDIGPEFVRELCKQLGLDPNASWDETMRYPLSLRPDQNGTVIAQAVDAPGALTVGRDEADAIGQATDALITLFAHLMSAGESIPPPSRPKRGQPCAILPPGVAAKLAIYQSMRAAGLTQAALAERLGCDPRQVRRLLDLDHRSRLDQLEAALAVLGKRLVVEVQDAA